MSDPVTPRPKKPIWKRWWLYVVAAIILFAFIGAVSKPPAASTAANTAASASAAPAAAPTQEPVAEPTSDAPFDYMQAGFVPSLKTTDKQCFGTYGCNVTVEVKLSVVDDSSIPDDASGSVTYEISGVKDGPIIGTVDLTGTSYTTPTEFFQTANKGATPKIKITDVTTN